jgi:hypothetical protein
MAKDLYHKDGNSTVKSSIPTKITNKAGKTDPELRNAGKLLKTQKKIQKGWSK